MIVPRQLRAFDTTEFCSILGISKTQLENSFQEAKRYSYYKPSIFLKQVSGQTYALLQEKLYKYPGFYVQPRTLRTYPRKIAGHLLGYVGEVDERTIKGSPYYQMGDYIGISGIERTYETELRGNKGVNVYLVDVYNRIKGSYSDGK